MGKGVRYLLRLVTLPIPFPIKWETVIVEYDPQKRFVDEQGAAGPFAYWRHEHGFEALESGKTLLRDVLIYELPFGMLGFIVAEPLIR